VKRKFIIEVDDDNECPFGTEICYYDRDLKKDFYCDSEGNLKDRPINCPLTEIKGKDEEIKIVDYDVIVSGKTSYFKKAIKEKIKDGWLLHGNLSTIDGYYTQALVKYD
jgi:hypothetical protein